MPNLLSIALTTTLLLIACAPGGAAPAAPAAPQAVATTAPSNPAVATAAPSSASAAVAPIPVKYAFAPRLPMIPVFVAQEKGFFAEQGLDVDFVPFAGGSNEMLPPLSQGQLDVAAAGLSAGMVNAAADGVLFRMVADEGQIGYGRSVYNIVVRSDVADRFRTVDDLRGSVGGVPAIGSGLSLPYTFFKMRRLPASPRPTAWTSPTSPSSRRHPAARATS